MEMEKLAELKSVVNNLSEVSVVSEYKRAVRLLGEIYKVQIAGKLDGGTSPTLTAERAAAEVDILATETEFDQLTQFFRDRFPGGA